MHPKSNFRNLVVLVAVFMIFVTSRSSAQSYCNPTFLFGCFSWRNIGVQLDSINWIGDADFCTEYDYTSYSTTLTAGANYTMKVYNGNWCGCGVWIDLNQDAVFDTTENFFHQYVALEINEYSFGITIPANVPTGTYRMRVIAGWGTDCYTTSSNGYGPCGDYQYGNFDDFTINVQGLATGVEAVEQIPLMEVNPNPVADVAIVSINEFQSGNAVLHLTDAAGKIIQSMNPVNQRVEMDMSELPKGIYFLRCSTGLRNETMKLVK